MTPWHSSHLTGPATAHCWKAAASKKYSQQDSSFVVLSVVRREPVISVKGRVEVMSESQKVCGPSPQYRPLRNIV